MLKSLIYISSSVSVMNKTELSNILNVSRKNNDPLDITGILVYYDGTFVQVLEGKQEAVDLIFSKILFDDRHKNVTLLNEEMIDQREFGAWEMSFRFLTTDEVLKAKGYVPLESVDFGSFVREGSSKHILSNFYKLNVENSTKYSF